MDATLGPISGKFTDFCEFSFTKATLESSGEKKNPLGVGVMRSKQKVLHPVSKTLILST